MAAKDIGRKLKCKKCSTALTVTEAGLEVDGGTGSKTSPVPAMIDDDEGDDAPLVKKKGKYERGLGGNPLAAVGGIPTVLFGFGVFLVIVFTSLPIIGLAGTDRATAYVDKLSNEMKVKQDALVPKNKKPNDWTDAERTKMREDQEKIAEDYAKKINDAKLDAEGTKISNRRDVWLETYGLMFGFIFVAFGCLGYLRSDQPLTLRIVAAVILGAMMLIMFGKFGGGCGRNPLG